MKVEYLEEVPLVRIFGTEQAEFRRLHTEMERLAQALGGSISIDGLPGFDAVGGCRVTLVSAKRRAGVRQLSAREFTGELAPTAWSTAAGFLEPFAFDNRRDTFQWLAGPDASFELGVGPIPLLVSCSADGKW